MNANADDTDAISEASMAAYADAANFQTGGAIGLAIEAWRDFLTDYPDHPMASKAAHYLGVCFMQEEQPNYSKAADAFQRALKDKSYDLREESLANYGWCLYASGTASPDTNSNSSEDGDRDTTTTAKLKKVIEVYEMLRSENPKSPFLDRSYFYSGEAAYQLGNTQQAIQFYNDLLSLDRAGESPLRCDALYARGVALEGIEQFDQAFASYQQLLDACAGNSLEIDVLLRMGDIQILRKEFDQAVKSFDQTIEKIENKAKKRGKENLADAVSNTNQDNMAYAIFRSAYALVQSDQPADAAARYERLAAEFPDSAYAASATLASAQSLYRSGNVDKAAVAFRKVLKQNNPVAATESAHWLARIAIAKGDPAAAARLAKDRIEQGIEGDFSVDLRLDLAEALSMNADTVKASMELYEQIYRDEPNDPMASRALYNAAFSGLQIGDTKRSLQLADEFLDKFPADALASDVRFVAAESHLAQANPGKAAEIYQQLLKDSQASNPQRLVWVLRAAAAMNANRDYPGVIAVIDRELPSMREPNQKAEAYLMAGQAHLMAGQLRQASDSFSKANDASPNGPRAAEAKLMQGQTLVGLGETDEAKQIWDAIIRQSPKSRMADQARFKLAELAGVAGNHDQAIQLYSTILESDQDPGLQPYAKYGAGLAQIQAGKFKEAANTLDQWIDSYAEHPLAGDALLSLGIARRNLQQFPLAAKHLSNFLDREPVGVKLGHALYELALIDTANNQPGKAATKLQRIVDEIHAYPAMDKVRYELGWALQESGQSDDAVKQFETMASSHQDSPLLSEAAYFIGQQRYRSQQWAEAAKQFSIAAENTTDPATREKAIYRMGWANFKNRDFQAAETAFAKQSQQFPDSSLAFDAGMMIAESRFKRGDYQAALEAYSDSRKTIQQAEETSKSIRDPAERQARELVLLHGGQSAAQLKRWDDALGWYNELRKRFPSSDYLPQTFYETGFAYQQKGDNAKALKFFGEVADNYRNSLAARARFMMGEIHFADRAFALAIPEFQRVMFGFGAGQAPDSIKNWQAKSGFEAGRCSELLMQAAKSESKRQRAAKISRDFYTYVTVNHPDHELASKAQSRLDALSPP